MRQQVSSVTLPPSMISLKKRKELKCVISLNAQFGEGWLLPAEIVSYARQGVNNVVSLQPFGCIANHIVSRGVEKRIKKFLSGYKFAIFRL